MRDIHKLSGMLESIAQGGGAGANAARHLLQWASAQPAAAAAAVGDGGDYGALDAGDADDADDDTQLQQQRLQQQQHHHQQQQQPQQQQPTCSSGSIQLDAADGAEEAAYTTSFAHLAQQHQRQQHPHQGQQQQQQHELQQHAQQPINSGYAAATQLLPRAGPEQWEQWEFRRRSGGFFKNQCGAGNATGTREALLR